MAQTQINGGTQIQSSTITLSRLASAAYSTSPTASTLAEWDASKNLSANSLIPGLTSTATAAGTTALTITSTQIQVFTGSTTQTVTLPTTSVVAGATYTIINQSSGNVTVQSSGANTILVLAGAGSAPYSTAQFTALAATPTTAANWQYSQYGGTGTGSVTFVTRETPSGTINGSNATFTLANTPISGTECLFLNGELLDSGAGNDYTISGSTITMLLVPLTGDKLRANYQR